MDPWRHKRFLDYRDRYQYFGRNLPLLTYEQFAAADDEYLALERAGDARSDEEEQRFVELISLLMRD